MEDTIERIAQIRSTPEAKEYASALLIKLEHLASAQRAQAVDPSLPQVFLAPWLELTLAALKDAA
mgnify:CR=1 FL=1